MTCSDDIIRLPVLELGGRPEEVINQVQAEVVVGNGYPYAIETADQTAVLQSRVGPASPFGESPSLLSHFARLGRSRESSAQPVAKNDE